MTEFIRTLPDGRPTSDRQEYLDAWGEAARKLEKVFGFTVTGFDPGFSVTTNRGDCRLQHLSLPYCFVEIAEEVLRTAAEAKDALDANAVFHTPFARSRKPDREWNEYERDAISRTAAALGQLSKYTA